MEKRKEDKPEYGNWVSKKLLYGTLLLGIVFLGLSILHLSLIIPAVLFFGALCYFLYARYKFLPEGGNLQNRIRDLVLDYLVWDGQGEALDIGCGNGPLVIKMAKKYPKAKITGLDFWGVSWDYSKAKC